RRAWSSAADTTSMPAPQVPTSWSSRSPSGFASVRPRSDGHANPGMTGGMRYLDLPTRKRYSVIGLGTWQFGSREWGYGRDYDVHASGDIVAPQRAPRTTLFDTAESC